MQSAKSSTHRGRVGKGFPGSPISSRSRFESCPRNISFSFYPERVGSLSTESGLRLRACARPAYPFRVKRKTSWARTRTREGVGEPQGSPCWRVRIPMRTARNRGFRGSESSSDVRVLPPQHHCFCLKISDICSIVILHLPT